MAVRLSALCAGCDPVQYMVVSKSRKENCQKKRQPEIIKNYYVSVGGEVLITMVDFLENM
jgi:hypothetical protein